MAVLYYHPTKIMKTEDNTKRNILFFYEESACAVASVAGNYRREFFIKKQIIRQFLGKLKKKHLLCSHKT